MQNTKELVQKDNNGQLVTTSLLVAWKFNKRHDHVIASIREILRTPENSVVLKWFVEATYTNEQNKQQPMFVMNKDGFDLLVMGFTGKKAMNYKIEYIQAFRKMEEQLTTSTDSLISLLETDAQTLNQLVKQQQRTLEIAKKTMQHDNWIVEADNRISKIEMLHDETHFTITGWAQLNKIKPPGKEKAAELGKLASKLSREQGIEIDKIPDKRYGAVNVYHKDILAQIEY